MAKIDITARLNAASVDGILASANQIYDENKGKFQEQVNEEFEDALEEAITSEETDKVVESIEEGIVHNALRKTKQILTKAEKYQARHNISAITAEEAEKIAQDKINETSVSSPDKLQAVKELSSWLEDNPDSAATMNAAIQDNAADIQRLYRGTGIDEYSKFSTGMDYAIGDVVLYDGVLFRFKADHAKGEWDYNDVEEWSEKKERESVVGELRGGVEKLEVFGEGVEKELTQYSSHQKRAYFYGNYKKGEKIKVSITGDATLVTEGVIAMRSDDEVTNFASLVIGSNVEIEIPQDTTYVVFLLNNNNIVKEGAVLCKMEGFTDLKKDVKNNTASISANNKDITNLKNNLENLEESSFKFRGAIEDVLKDSLNVGVYTVPPTALNLPEGHPKDVYSWLVVYQTNFRVLYFQSNELWWTIDSVWVKIPSQQDISYITERIDGLEKAIFGVSIGEEEVIGEALKLDQYVNKDTGRVNTYANNNLSIAPFPIQKREVYKISVAKTTNAAGYVLCYAETINSLECTPIINTVGNRGKFDYTYAADKDGYLFIGISTDSEYTTVVNEKKQGNIFVETVLLKSAVQSLYEDVERLNGSGIDWSNKKWVVIGDSLSTNNRTTDKRYIDYIVEKTGIQVEVLAVGGSSYGKPQLENNAFFQQAARVASDADIVTIFGSFNEWYLKDSEGNITDGPTSLGKLDSEDVSTRYGCMNMALKNIFANAPLARVGVIYPTPWKTVNPFTPTSTGNDLMEMLENVTKKWGVPKLDLFHGSGMRPWEEEYRLLVYSKDSGGVDGNPSGVHPNEIGHEVIATHVLEFMKKLLW